MVSAEFYFPRGRGEAGGKGHLPICYMTCLVANPAGNISCLRQGPVVTAAHLAISEHLSRSEEPAVPASATTTLTPVTLTLATHAVVNAYAAFIIREDPTVLSASLVIMEMPSSAAVDVSGVGGWGVGTCAPKEERLALPHFSCETMMATTIGLPTWTEGIPRDLKYPLKISYPA